MKKEQERRSDPSFQNKKTSTSKIFALVLIANEQIILQWFSGPYAVDRLKRFKQNRPAENTKEGQKPGKLTLSGPISILENSSNYRSHSSNWQITHQ